MNKALIINGHVPYEYSKGGLNAAFVDRAAVLLTDAGYDCEISIANSSYDNDEEIEKFQTADIVIFQFPLYNMGVPWVLKKYIDDVFLAGGDGRLYAGDGRTRSDPSQQYGTGGALGGKAYFLSITANAPAEAFNDPTQNFFAGISVSDLLRPLHLACKFNDMKCAGVFTAHDVHKNPNVNADFERFDTALQAVLPK